MSEGGSKAAGTKQPSSPFEPNGGGRRGKGGSLSLLAVPIPREERRVVNQRGEERFGNIIHKARLHFRKRVSVVRVVNVSSGGAMIASSISPRIGELVELEFAQGNCTKSIVRWFRDGRIGLEFLDETIIWDCFQPSAAETQEKSGEALRPRPPRHDLVRNGTLHWNGARLPVRLRNISAAGAQVDGKLDFVPGTEVELNLSEAGILLAEVRWSKDGHIGLRFRNEFNLGSLAAARGRAKGQGASEAGPERYWVTRFQTLSLAQLGIDSAAGTAAPENPDQT